MTDVKIPPAFYLVLSSPFVIEMKLLKCLLSLKFYEIIYVWSPNGVLQVISHRRLREILVSFFFNLELLTKLSISGGGGRGEKVPLMNCIWKEKESECSSELLTFPRSMLSSTLLMAIFVRALWCSLGSCTLIILHFVRGRCVLAPGQCGLGLFLSLQCLTACTEQYPN